MRDFTEEDYKFVIDTVFSETGIAISKDDPLFAVISSLRVFQKFYSQNLNDLTADADHALNKLYTQALSDSKKINENALNGLLKASEKLLSNTTAVFVENHNTNQDLLNNIHSNISRLTLTVVIFSLLNLVFTGSLIFKLF